MVPAHSKTKLAKVLTAKKLAGTVLLLSLGSVVAPACSAPIECTPPVPAGAVYRVTLLAERAESQKCHVVDGFMMSPFMLTVGKPTATDADPACTTSPATSAPIQRDVIIDQCVPKGSDMLGVYCAITYESNCGGHISFYFTNAPGATVDWSANVIENVVFRVEDRATNCLGGLSDCLDQYTAKLERLP